jgi:hypothetical protein
MLSRIEEALADAALLEEFSTKGRILKSVVVLTAPDRKALQ